MYNFDPSIPTAVSSSDDDGVIAALNWAVAKYNDDESAETITVWTSRKSQKSNNPEIEHFIDSNSRVEHITGHGAQGSAGKGPLVVVWGEPEDIAAAVGYGWKQVSSIVVIEWNPERLYPWVKFSNAEVLGDASIWDDQSAEIHPVVALALRKMTGSVNHNNTVSGSGFEKDHTVGPLLSLHDAGYELNSRVIKGFAAAEGWRGDNVKHLGDYVDQINRGSRPRFRAGSTRKDYVKFLESEVDGSPS